MEFGQDIAPLLNENLIQIIISNPRTKDGAAKVKIRPFLGKDGLCFQETRYVGTQVFHENFGQKETLLRLENYMKEAFRQCEILTNQERAVLLVSKKGKITFQKKRLQSGGEDKAAQPMTHNREKQYILPEGEPADFLVELGVQTKEGLIHKNRYDKFRQINRYLEFIRDVLEKLPDDRTIRIIDFGCGKSYLTFAMYYYLHVQQGRDVEVTGLDLKKDVIEHCNAIAKKAGLPRAAFYVWRYSEL